MALSTLRVTVAASINSLALAEAYGVDDSEPHRKRIAAALANSEKFILSAQDAHKGDAFVGGWRYEPNSPDSDLSLSAWNALTLRACQDVGIGVPRPAVQRAVKFVLKCYNPQAPGFSYQPGGATSPAMTGVGILCIHILDGANGPEVTAAAKTLAAKPLDDSSQFPYYGMYYATQAAFQAGDSTWNDVSKVTLPRIIRSQQPDGGWPDVPSESGGAGRLYTTTMALLTLSIPYRLLPVYQR